MNKIVAAGTLAVSLALSLPPTPSIAAPMVTVPMAYCTQTSGKVVISGNDVFCQYTDAHDGSRIVISVRTLYDDKPSLAALLYILKPAPIGRCNGNPSSCYCAQLGGTGKAMNLDARDIEVCVFGDESSIDSWGLRYHSAGIIRGIDLTKVMRYEYSPTVKR